MDDPRNPIVVGIDGSESSRGALRWAAHEAAVRKAPLRVLHAVGSAEPELWTAARAMIADGVAEARAIGPDLTVTGEVIDGQPFTELCAAAQNAEMIVVANRGLGGFDGLLLGSVSCQIALHARCTVTIVHNAPAIPGSPTDQADELPVLVGTDSSQESEKAIGVAFAQAQLHGAGVVAIRAWKPQLVAHRGEVRHSKASQAAIDRAAQYAFGEDLSTWREQHPEVPVETRFVAQSPAAALVAASAAAQLMVVGSRGHGDFPGERLGATTYQLLHHSHCPIMVVR